MDRAPSRSSALAGLSVDVDSVASHLQGYGIEGVPDEGAAYSRAIPRALDLFDRMGCRATFFLVANDALRHEEVVQEIVRRGHEVASHSMTHQLPLAGRGQEVLDKEIGGSKAVLERLTGQRVRGFRAPSWDAPSGVLSAVLASGYSYDASAYPSFLLPLLRAAVAKRSETGRSAVSGRFEGVLGPRHPWLQTLAGGALVRIPISTVPGVRFPHYHTLRFMLPAPIVGAIGRLAGLGRRPVSYVFHAVDFLETEADGLDSRISRHPGMNRGLPEKLAMAKDALTLLGAARQVVSLAQVARLEFGDSDQGDGAADSATSPAVASTLHTAP